MSLAQKLKPKVLLEIKLTPTRQKQVEHYIANEDRNHAVLITGNSGCGKTTIAGAISNSLEIPEANVNVYNSSDFRGIDFIRTLILESPMLPLYGDTKAYILDECHKLTGDAQEAMLKLLEEVPSHVYLFLVTTNPEKLKVTLKRRCFNIDMPNATVQDITGYLNTITSIHKIDASEEMIKKIAAKAEGAYGIALKQLEQVMGNSDEDLLELSEKESLPIDLARGLISSKGWKTISEILKNLKGADPEGTRRLVLNYATTVLLNTGSTISYNVVAVFSEPVYDSGFAGLCRACYRVSKK